MYTESLRRTREAAEMTQKDVAKALNISQFAVSKWERGEGSEPSIGRLIQLADLYNVSVDVLIGRKQA